MLKTSINRSTIQSRHLGSFIRSVLCMDPPASPDEPTVENRFHIWDQSPSPDLRLRAATIRANAKCPVTKKEINFVCPYSGIPTHHSKEAWESDTEYHETKKYEILKKVNIYEHDLRSNRQFHEFDFPNVQPQDTIVNFSTWDTFLYTRQFYSMDTEFQLAVVTKMLTFPLTISSILHQYSPYFMKPQGPITLEGLKSLSALRYTLYPENRVSSLRERPIRLFILNSKIESMLPGHVWKELTYLFPSITFEIHFIGSESYFDKDKKQFIQSNQPIIQRMDDTLTFIHHTSDFDKLHEAKDFFPYDPYLDVFFAFHPRFSHNSISNSNPLWLNSLPGLLESKCAIFFTGFTKLEMDLDMQFLQDNYGDECDLLMDPIQNVFNCTKWEFNDFNPMETFRFNELVAGFRGKRYHAVHQN